MKTKSLLHLLQKMGSTLQGSDLDTSLKKEIYRLFNLLSTLKEVENYTEKIACLDKVSEVEKYFSQPSSLRTFLTGLSEDCEYVIKAIFAIKQGNDIFDVPCTLADPVPLYRNLLNDLLAIDRCYQDIGGIIGYQYLTLCLLIQSEDTTNMTSFRPVQGIDLSDENNPKVRHAILEGIRNQKNMAEFYPVGGAADRLELKDDLTGEDLPAACLTFQGKHLLEGMVHDLQSREFLYFKLFNEQIVTPLALMTSTINHNHEHIEKICIKNRWFSRPRESFQLFMQPSVPVFTQDGNWCLEKPLQLLLRPGGHGMIWKLAEEQGVFDWFHSLGKKKALVRQVNNPMIGIDYGLSAFLGIGDKENKQFGFFACERCLNAHEGIIVLKEMDSSEGKFVTVTNIEYCDFEKYGIKDQPKDEGSSHSLFLANTNILFIDLQAIQKAIKTMPFPGLLVNFRMGSHYRPFEGEKKEKIARLETTMQNIAEAFITPVEKALPENLSTYIAFNKRSKTISTTKRKTVTNDELMETPEGCFYNIMQNIQQLMSHECHIKLSSKDDECQKNRPSFLMSYHPALGPFYSIIKQKIQGGEIFKGSALQLEIADLEIKNLFLNGSLRLFADHIMGHMDSLGNLVYSNQTGQCILKNVRIENEGINWNDEDHLFWKNEMSDRENLTIYLKGHSRFEAHNVIFKGEHIIEVPDGVHMIVTQDGENLHFEKHPLKGEQPFWTYQVNSDESIQLLR